MSIRHTCGCGAQIRLPDSAAGRKARCKTCGTVFQVSRPAAQAAPVTAQPGPPAREPADDQQWDWQSGDADAGSPAAPHPMVFDLSLDLDEKQTTAMRPVPSAVEDRDWIVAPTRSFWSDCGAALLLFLEPANLVAFVALTVTMLIVPLLSAFSFGLVGLIFYMYLAAFYFATIRESASGEDELPSVWVNNFLDDLIYPALHFIGTRLWVVLPAVLLAIVQTEGNWWSRLDALRDWALLGQYPSNAVRLLAWAGLFFWPAVMLAVAIGGTLSGLWPHTILRIVLAAPHAYLAVCVVSLMPLGIEWLTAQLTLQMASLRPTRIGVAIRVEGIVGVALSMYAMIVAMRVIGLYYRHYKHRFPWTAE